MAGDDPIMAVSKVFASLADEGGAAADSLDTLNTILKNSLNRTLIRFNRTMADTVKSVAAFNVGLKNASKRMSTNVTQKQAARMGAASQASEAIHRTKVYVEQRQSSRQASSQRVESAFDELVDVIKSPFIVAINEASAGLSSLVNTVANVSQFLISLKTMFDLQTLLPKQNPAEVLSNLFKSYEDAIKQGVDESLLRVAYNPRDAIKKEEAIANAYGISNMRMVLRSAKDFEDPENPTRKQQRINLVTAQFTKLIQVANNNLSYFGNQLAESRSLLEIYKGTLGDNTRELERAQDSANIKFYYQDVLEQTKKLYASKLAAAETTTLGDVFEKFNFGNIKSSIAEFIMGLKASTALLTGAFAAAITFVAYKMYDLGKNAIPRVANFFMKPLKEIYGFITGPLQSAFNKITTFVATLNPAYGEMANRALDDLSALVGQMLLPVFNAMLGTLKVFNSILFKNMKNFQGLFNSVGNALAQFGGNAIGAFFNLMQSAIPVLNAFVAQLESALPQILTSMQQLFGTLQSYMPTFIRILEQVGSALDIYIKQKARELGREMDLAAQAARNDAEAVAINGGKFIEFTDITGQFMYALKTTILTVERGSNALIGGFMGFLDEVENVINPWSDKSIWTAEGRAAKEAEMDAEQKRRKEFANQQEGIGVFDVGGIAGGEIGAAAGEGLQEGFAAKGASFQEIGQLGKNLAAASFGMGAGTVEDQQLNVQQQILGAVNGMLQNQNQFNGAAPVQGVR